MNTRAHWAEDVPDLYGDPSQLNRYLTLPEVANRTSFSPNTLRDALSRAKVTRKDNPMYALSRPAGRVGNQPYYSPEQVEQALKIAQSAQHRRVNDDGPLPLVTAEEAGKVGLVSIAEFAEFADVHEQTVWRWRREIETFPKVVAERPRSSQGAKAHPGGPFKCFELEAMQDWLREYVETSRGKRVEKLAQHLRETHGWKITPGVREAREIV